MHHYHRKEWKAFRNEVMELDGRACVRCGRTASDGIVLQVHHKHYFPKKLPWEYPQSECETLCKGCHSAEHGLTRPSTGWECFGTDDLGSLDGECELCGTELRYVFLVQHDKWPSMEVGEICCDHLTETREASDFTASRRKMLDRRKTFVSSPRWHVGTDGTESIRQSEIDIVIEPIQGGCRLVCNKFAGKKVFTTSIDAKLFLFELLEKDELQIFLRKRMP